MTRYAIWMTSLWRTLQDWSANFYLLTSDAFSPTWSSVADNSCTYTQYITQISSTEGREREREREKKKKKKRREEREREKSDTSSPYWRNFVKVRARSFVLCSCTSAILIAVKIGWSGVRLTDPRCRCCKVDLIPPSPPRVGAVTLSKRRKIGRSRCIISFMSVTTALKAVRCHIREESYAVCWLFQIIATRSVRKGGETQWRCRSRE